MARSAQKYAETCPHGHDSNAARNKATGVITTSHVQYGDENV